MRHAQSDHNVGNWISGCLETDKKSNLTEEGIKQAHRLGEELKTLAIDLIYHSPFQRVAKTAEIINQYLNVPIFVEERLKQYDCGIHNGKTWKEREAFYAHELEKLTKRPPGGENLLDLKARMVAALHDIDSRHFNKNVLVVSHGNPLRMLQSAMLNLPDEAVFSDMRVLRWKSDVSPEPFVAELLIAQPVDYRISL